MGTGPVKGFGVTLTIGVTVSMFTALVVTRLIFDFLLAKNLLSRLHMLPREKIEAEIAYLEIVGRKDGRQRHCSDLA